MKSMENKRSEDFYDHYVDRQVGMGINHRHFAIIDNLVKHGLKSHHDVLEIGAGVGTATILISKVVKQGTILVNDISSKSLDVAKERLKKRTNLEYAHGDIVNLEISHKFDFIVLPDVLEHIPLEQHNGLFKKLDQLLKPKGIIFINIPNPHYLHWVRANQPELLQEIDQPVYLSPLIENLRGTALSIMKVVDYSIYIEECDYRYILIRKTPQTFTDKQLPAHGIMDKLKYKLRYGK